MTSTMPTRRAFLAGAAATAAAILAPPVAPLAAAPEAGFATIPAKAPEMVRTFTAPRRFTPWFDEDCNYYVADPNQLLATSGDGASHVMVDGCGDPTDRILVDGQTVRVGSTVPLGQGVLTVLPYPDDEDADPPEPAFTLDPPMPARGEREDEIVHIALDDDPENCALDEYELADDLEPGSYAVNFYSWRDDMFIYRAATGTLEPWACRPAPTRHG